MIDDNAIQHVLKKHSKAIYTNICKLISVNDKNVNANINKILKDNNKLVYANVQSMLETHTQQVNSILDKHTKSISLQTHQLLKDHIGIKKHIDTINQKKPKINIIGKIERDENGKMTAIKVTE
jgi:hypothetical protein